MENKQKKLSKGKIRAIIVAAVSLAIALALIITNFFVPVKYIASYMVKGNKGAADGVMRVRFVDVGYGDCTIIELPDGKNMLIDGGNGSSKNTARILKYLNSCSIKTIDYLVCSSVSAERCGGLTELIRYKNVKNIYMPYCLNTYVTDEYRTFFMAAYSSGADIKISEYGERVENTDCGYFFEFLSPSAHTAPEGEYAALNANPTSLQARNDATAVIWLEYLQTSILFAGDATDFALNRICNDYLISTDFNVNLDALDIIKVPDHGSAASACTQLYEIARPSAAVISVGDNARNCPSLEAITNAVNSAGENIYRTDEVGTVTVEVTAQGYSFV